jgi:hypothetical protein
VLATLTFLTPAGGLVALAALGPLAAAAAGAARVARLRTLLGLPAPGRAAGVPAFAAPAAVVLALGLAAAQPALSHRPAQRVRTDAQVLFVIDTSKSMAAAPALRGAPRLERAKLVAARLRAAIPAVPAGIATFTDRVLPQLLPVPDRATFAATLRRSIAVEAPPPRIFTVHATNYGVLSTIPPANYFDPSARRRVLVLLTDGESSPVDAGAVGHALATRVAFLAVRIWRPGEVILGPRGKPDTQYRPDPGGRAVLAALATVTHGRAFEEAQARSAATALRKLVGHGPTTKVPGGTRDVTPLAPYAALAALLPLGLAFRRRAG